MPNPLSLTATEVLVMDTKLTQDPYDSPAHVGDDKSRNLLALCLRVLGVLFLLLEEAGMQSLKEGTL